VRHHRRAAKNVCSRPFPPAFLSKKVAHSVWEMAHPADNPILICSLRIICDTRSHCVHDFEPTDVGEYVEGRVFHVWAFWGVVWALVAVGLAGV
jgi:hypothetical protein